MKTSSCDSAGKANAPDSNPNLATCTTVEQVETGWQALEARCSAVARQRALRNAEAPCLVLDVQNGCVKRAVNELKVLAFGTVSWPDMHQDLDLLTESLRI